MKDFLTFRRMLMPIQSRFYSGSGVVIVIVAGLVILVTSKGDARNGVDSS